MATMLFGGVGMNGLKSFVPELIQKKGWDVKTFAAHCMLVGMGQSTAYRLARGETNFNIETLQQIMDILEVSSISELVDVEKDQ